MRFSLGFWVAALLAPVTLADPSNRTSRQLSTLEELFAKLEETQVDTEVYEEIKADIAKLQKAGAPSRHMRGLQTDPATPENLRADRTAQDFLFPCIALPLNPLTEGWSLLELTDDASIPITLNFDFSFYGRTFPRGTVIYLNNNGNISFDNAQSSFTSEDFPSASFSMIAPFWSDVDTREQGQLWYRQTNDYLVAIWSEVGYYFTASDKVNTFQVIIAANRGVLANRGNTCFCYADMDWTTGDASFGNFGFGGTPATVGMNRGNGIDFVQFGRFDQPGTAYDGGYGNPDGVDFLDNNRLGLPDAFCLDVSTDNVPPVLQGFPAGPVSTVCDQTFNLMLRFLTPEPTQTVSVTAPTALPAGLVLTPGGTDIEATYFLEWTPLTNQAGTYNLPFTASDSSGGTTTETLVINVPTCNVEPKCEPLTASELSQCQGTFDPYPICEPFNSPDYCPAAQSFTSLLRTRNEIFSQDEGLIFDDDFWFPHLNDKAFANVMTSSEGYATPEVFCCEDTLDQLFDACFPITGPLVVRASDLHSGNGVFVFPTGIGGVEALRGTTMDLNDLRLALEALGDSTTYLIEEFIPGDAGVTSLPTEYKFHVFNGMIGAITVVHNRGTDCMCVAEIDANGERLDTFGCFYPASSDLGRTSGQCYDIDFDTGATSLGGGKNGDSCSELPPLKECLFDYMKEAAERLGEVIGVYARIDMFVGGNGAPYVQEYSINHHGARKHCWSRQDPTGCVDSCFMGELWAEKSALPNGDPVYGGPRTDLPGSVDQWDRLNADNKCSAVRDAASPSPFTC